MKQLLNFTANMTRLSDAEQQKRIGGGGVYYHLSYWGRPHDYMWLTTEQPGLVYNEMKEAYDYNARKLWIVNVHEPKVAAYDLELFLDMAWNINSVSPSTLEQHLQNWLSLQFGKEAGEKLLPVMKDFFEALGVEGSKKALCYYAMGSFPNQKKELADATHFNPYGAYEVAKMVIMGMKQHNLPMLKGLKADFTDYNPQKPDDADKFVWYRSAKNDVTKPDGD